MKSDLLHKCVDQLSRQAQVEAGLRALDGAEKNKTGMALALSEELLLPIWWTDKIDPGLTESLSQESNLRFVLAAEYITPKTAAQLRQLGIQYMDTAGNAYISAPGIHIVISGRPKPKPIKSTATPPSDGKTGKAFQATGLKVIYALINESKLANASMRALAEASGVSLGSVNGIHKDLIAHRFLKKTSSGIRLMNKDKLAQRWAELYPYAIRQKLLFGRYTCENNDWWESIVPGERIQVGGEAAAYQLSNYLTPKDGLIY
ncbi:MAG: type IV toxin-antitoxin system AbiEi family antitoxin, partial [Oceanobacter sp.]